MKRTNRVIMALLLVGFMTPSITMADRYRENGFYDHAKVVKVEPIFNYVSYQEPHRDCYRRVIDRPGQRSYTSVIGGSIVGGVIGNQFGKGRGQDAMTVAGALLGASIGNDLYNRRLNHYSDSERVCDVRYSSHRKKELIGYQVVYRYKGRHFEREMDHHPGKKLRVWISVSPEV